MRRYTIEEFIQDMETISAKLRSSDIFDSIKDIYGVPRGGLAIALWLSHELGKPLIVKRSHISPYTLVVDDIADRGYTLRELQPAFSFTIFTNPTSIFIPTFWLREKDDEWIQFPWETPESTKTKQDGDVSGP